MVGCVLSQLKHSELYTLSCGKGHGLRPRLFPQLRINVKFWSAFNKFFHTKKGRLANLPVQEFEHKHFCQSMLYFPVSQNTIGGLKFKPNYEINIIHLLLARTFRISHGGGGGVNLKPSSLAWAASSPRLWINVEPTLIHSLVTAKTFKWIKPHAWLSILRMGDRRKLLYVLLGLT